MQNKNWQHLQIRLLIEVLMNTTHSIYKLIWRMKSYFIPMWTEWKQEMLSMNWTIILFYNGKLVQTKFMMQTVMVLKTTSILLMISWTNSTSQPSSVLLKTSTILIMETCQATNKWNLTWNKQSQQIPTILLMNPGTDGEHLRLLNDNLETY